jgi:hypothetical protein
MTAMRCFMGLEFCSIHKVDVVSSRSRSRI